MKKSFSRRIREHDWFAVFIEVIVIAVGLLMALQVDRWREEWGERKQEHGYIGRLISSVEEDVPRIQLALDLAEVRLGFANLLIEISGKPELATNEPAVFIAAVDQAAFTYSPRLNRHTLEDLRSTGNMALIRNHALKRQLHDYYDFDDVQAQYRPLQFLAENRHFELAAGILTQDQSLYMQDTWPYSGKETLEELKLVRRDPKEILESAQRLQSRTEFVAWLPQIRQMQLEQHDANDDRMMRAKALLETLRAYQTELDGTGR